MVTHGTLERSPHARVTFDLLRNVATGIAYRGVRNRSTIGGSVVRCDPAADWLSCLSALDAKIHIAGPDGARQLSIAEFLLGSFTTALQVGELLTGIEVLFSAITRAGATTKHNHKVGEFAEAIGCVVEDRARGLHRIIAGALSSPPVLLFGDAWPADFTIGHLRQAVCATKLRMSKARISISTLQLGCVLSKVVVWHDRDFSYHQWRASGCARRTTPLCWWIFYDEAAPDGYPCRLRTLGFAERVQSISTACPRTLLHRARCCV